jgi:small subunit ribosomal protein S21
MKRNSTPPLRDLRNAGELVRLNEVNRLVRTAGLSSRKELTLKVFVRDNNVDQALRILKKKLQRDGLFREIKRRKAYEKPSERKAREKGEAIRRGRKAARKLAQREGLIAGPRPRQSTFGRRSA